MNQMTIRGPVSIKFRICLVVLILMLCPITGYTAPNDVKGWQETYWGMTPEQLEQALGNTVSVRKDNSGESTYQIDDYNIFQHNFYVSFFWRERRFLNRIEIVGHPTPGFTGSQRDLAEKIRLSLISKYGKGKVLKDEHTDSRFLHDAITGAPIFLGEDTKFTVRWAFPSTIITLTFGESQANQSPQSYISNIKITYEANDQSKL